MASVNLQFSPAAQSCLTLCDRMNHSTPGLPVHHNSQSLLKLTYIVLVTSFNHLTFCLPLLFLPSIFLSISVFQVSQFFASGGQSIGVSASASVVPMNIQDWFPLGCTGWISLQSKGYSSVFSNITVQKHQFFSAQPSLWMQFSHLHMTTAKIIALTIWTFAGKGIALLFNTLSRFVIIVLPRSKCHHLQWFWNQRK